MGYSAVLYDEDGNSYTGASAYETYEEAEEEIEDTLNGSAIYIDYNEIVGDEIKKD